MVSWIRERKKNYLYVFRYERLTGARQAIFTWITFDSSFQAEDNEDNAATITDVSLCELGL